MRFRVRAGASGGAGGGGGLGAMMRSAVSSGPKLQKETFKVKCDAYACSRLVFAVVRTRAATEHGWHVNLVDR